MMSLSLKLPKPFKALVAVTAALILLAPAAPSWASDDGLRHATIGEKGTKVDATEGANGKVRLTILLADSNQSVEGTLTLGFGLGVASDDSTVSMGESPIESGKLSLIAVRSGISHPLEVEILDDRMVQIAFPDVAPARPDIAFIFGFPGMNYSKACAGDKIVSANGDASTKYIAAIATAKYLVFYGSSQYPPLIFTGFSPNQTVQLISANGTISGFYGSDKTVRMSFLDLPAGDTGGSLDALKAAAGNFLSACPD